jgi:ubiquinol oxidase
MNSVLFAWYLYLFVGVAFYSSAMSLQSPTISGYVQKQHHLHQDKLFPTNELEVGLNSTININLPWYFQTINKAMITVVKGSLDTFFGKRYYARFIALETVARVPYFAYMFVLHFYETMRWFHRKEYIKLHFAENWNELHHLLIMEELAGKQLFIDRIIAQTMSIGYFIYSVLLYLLAPAVAYDLSRRVEMHAYHSYDKYIRDHQEELKKLPPSRIAKEYYESSIEADMFDSFHLNEIQAAIQKRILSPEEKRRPKIQNLFDVFCNIRDDEWEHVLSMEYLQQRILSRKKDKRNYLDF